MIRIEDVIEKVAANRPDPDVELIRKAYLFSALHHRGQKRASGEPYLVHPLEVADILADMRLDEVSVSTGLLHDVVEDTLVDLDTIKSYFGDEITQLVDGLTKIAHISNLSKEKQQAENVRKMVLAMITDVRVVLIKLADRLHNMRTMQFLKPEKRARISQETLDIYAPIAHRLGMGKVRSELEDLAFQNLYPEEYRRLAKDVDARRPELEAILDKIRTAIESKLTENDVPFVAVQGRVWFTAHVVGLHGRGAAHGVVVAVVDAEQLDLLDHPVAGQALPGGGVDRPEARQLQRAAAEGIGAHLHALRPRPRERLHRDQPGERPRQREHAEDDAGHVVPLHPAGIRHRRAQLERAATPVLGHAEDQAEHRHDARGHREPDDHLVPERLVGAEGGEIEPVRDDAGP